MRRRDVIVGLASIATAWPLAGRTEHALPLVGFLNGGSQTFTPYLIGLRQGLKDAGYIEGQNVLIEYRWAEGNYDRLPGLAAELLARDARVLVVNTPASKVAQAATTTIPIVFMVGADPVQLGLIKSLNRPGGNLTGVVSLVDETGPKRVELLRELLPTNSTIAHLVNPANPAVATMSASVAEAAKKLGQTLRTLNVSNDSEIDNAFEQLTKLKVGALLVSNDPFFTARREYLVDLAERYSLPTIYAWREFVDVGGLFSYGTSLKRLYQRAGVYVGRILNGENPADLPVQQSTDVELVVNLKTARRLGLTFPVVILGRADEVIE
jgi:putative tryptophan/tyrosine transport system substrate-binding protein